jgi:iron complex transport system substrate-binding protein
MRKRLAVGGISMPGSYTGKLRQKAAMIFLGISALMMASLACYAAEIVDARGRTVETGAAVRIVTLGSDVTEIVYELGLGDKVVGVDRASKYPRPVTSKPNVGSRRQLSVEGLVALRPDLIIAANDIGPPEAIDVLASLQTPVVFVPQENSPDGIRAKIELIASALEMEEQGQVLSRRVLDDFNSAANLASAVATTDRKKVIFFHGLIKLSAAGAGTAADAIIRYAGGLNPMQIVQGYKAASEEKLIELAPDVILMMGDGKGGPTPDQVFANPALAATPAGRNRHLIVLEGTYMIGFGPRTATTIRELAQALYPATDIQNTSSER